jgi:hypothetical protein
MTNLFLTNKNRFAIQNYQVLHVSGTYFVFFSCTLPSFFGEVFFFVPLKFFFTTFASFATFFWLARAASQNRAASRNDFVQFSTGRKSKHRKLSRVQGGAPLVPAFVHFTYSTCLGFCRGVMQTQQCNEK